MVDQAPPRALRVHLLISHRLCVRLHRLVDHLLVSLQECPLAPVVRQAAGPFRHHLAPCLHLVVLFRLLLVNALLQVVRPLGARVPVSVLAQVHAQVQVLVLALVAHVPAQAVHALVLAALAQVALVVLVLVVQVVHVPVLVLVPVDPAARVALVVLVLVVAPAVLVAVPAAAVLVVRATVNVAHHARSRAHVVAENLKNYSRSSRNTPTAMPLFQRAPSWSSVDLLHKNLHQS